MIVAVVWSLCGMTAYAQTDESLDPEVGARVSVGVDKKIVKGVHVTFSEEARFDNNFRSFNRLQTSLGFTHKPNPYFKWGFGYVFIAPYSSSDGSFKEALKHRLYFDVKGTVRAGSWAFSLKERFQWTYRMGEMNEYQNPRNALTLKSRLMVKHGGKVASPYVYFELRHALNAPVIYANYDGTAYRTDDGSLTGDPGWFLHSFRGGYINRYRSAVGVDLKFNKRNHLDLYFLGDYVVDKVVDANSSGTKLKSYTRETGFQGWLGAEYVFSF